MIDIMPDDKEISKALNVLNSISDKLTFSRVKMRNEGDIEMDFMEQCDDCLCKECLENCNENPDGCCYTCCKDSDECEPISQCPFGWYHDN